MTTRPTILPARRSSSDLLVWSSGRFSTGIGAILPAFTSVDHLARLGGGADVAAHDGQRAQGEHGHRQREAAADQADDDGRAALGHGGVRESSDLSEPAKSTAAPTPPPEALAMALRAPASAGSNASAAPSLQRGLALAGVDIGNEDGLVGQRARELQPHHADAARARRSATVPRAGKEWPS